MATDDLIFMNLAELKYFTVLLRILTKKVMSTYGSGQQSYITSFLTAGTPEQKLCKNFAN